MQQIHGFGSILSDLRSVGFGLQRTCSESESQQLESLITMIKGQSSRSVPNHCDRGLVDPPELQLRAKSPTVLCISRPRNEIVMDRPIIPIWPSERSKGAWKLQQPLLTTFTHQSTVPLKNQPRRYHAGRDRLDLVSTFPWHPLAPPTQAISKRDVMLPDLEVKNAIDPNSILPSRSLILP